MKNRTRPMILWAGTLCLAFFHFSSWARANGGEHPSAAPRLGIVHQGQQGRTLLFRGTYPGQILRLYGCLADPRTECSSPWMSLGLLVTNGSCHARLPLQGVNLQGWALRVRGLGSRISSQDLVVTGQTWAPPGVLGNGLPDRERPRGSGEVIVSEVMKDPAQVPDHQGEWFEVFNTTNSWVDMEGWTLADLGTDMTILDNGGAGILVPPRGYLVLGREIDPQFNGGVPVQAVVTGFFLGNGADEIILSRPAGTLVDALNYEASGAWVDPVGASLQLSNRWLAVNWNDWGEHWCQSMTPWAAGDLGSPGSSNSMCP